MTLLVTVPWQIDLTIYDDLSDNFIYQRTGKITYEEFECGELGREFYGNLDRGFERDYSVKSLLGTEINNAGKSCCYVGLYFVKNSAPEFRRNSWDGFRL